MAFCEEDGPLHIFNLASWKHICTLNPDHTVFTEDELALTPDGKHLLYTVEALPPGASKGNSDEIHIEVCDTKTGICWLICTNEEELAVTSDWTDLIYTPEAA